MANLVSSEHHVVRIEGQENVEDDLGVGRDLPASLALSPSTPDKACGLEADSSTVSVPYSWEGNVRCCVNSHLTLGQLSWVELH